MSNAQAWLDFAGTYLMVLVSIAVSILLTAAVIRELFGD